MYMPWLSKKVDVPTHYPAMADHQHPLHTPLYGHRMHSLSGLPMPAGTIQVHVVNDLHADDAPLYVCQAPVWLGVAVLNQWCTVKTHTDTLYFKARVWIFWVCVYVHFKCASYKCTSTSIPALTANVPVIATQHLYHHHHVILHDEQTLSTHNPVYLACTGGVHSSSTCAPCTHQVGVVL